LKRRSWRAPEDCTRIAGREAARSARQSLHQAAISVSCTARRSGFISLKALANPAFRAIPAGLAWGVQGRARQPQHGQMPMEAASYVALSSQMALTRQLDVVANNLANASTPAFKGERMIFAEFVSQKATASSNVSFVQDLGTARDASQGPLAQTGNPLDLALQGDGYFKVQTPLGLRYTRNGRFQLDGTGQLVNAQGYALLGDGDSPITLPTGVHDITVTRDGTVSTLQGDTGHIQVVKFADERALSPASGGVYVTDAQPIPVTDTVVRQGMIEESNVQPILEMTRMMKISQNFSFAKDFGDGESTRATNAIDKLGKVV
jgi:flagellar basal-body rod protein FlgF